MEETDVRGERLGPLGRLRIRLGRCPECGGRLVDEVDGDLISSRTWSPAKCTARTFGAPTIHNVEGPPCKRCDACERWYLGKWAYRSKAE
jgi:hypothetical protein